MVAMQTTLGTTLMQDTAVKYGSFMEALMDSAQTADYWPVDYLPSPHAQAWLWHNLDNRAITLQNIEPDMGNNPPTGHSDYVLVTPRHEGHTEEAYLYGPGVGQAGTVIWYRCGMNNPDWVVLTAIDR